MTVNTNAPQTDLDLAIAPDSPTVIEPPQEEIFYPSEDDEP
ncbi:MAG: hypothetical protein ACFCBU_15935 [Cyanophyceae cyanobacterium]